MEKPIAPAISVHDIDLCPCVRYARSTYNNALREFKEARNAHTRSEAIGRALDAARWLQNVTIPHARWFQGPAYAEAYTAIFKKLIALTGNPQNWELHESQFPDDGGRQMIKDQLESIQTMLRDVLKRRQANHTPAKQEAA